MPFCPSCGSELEAAARFCAECGDNVTAIVNSLPSESGASEVEPTAKSSKLATVIGVIIALLALGAIREAVQDWGGERSHKERYQKKISNRPIRRRAPASPY